MRASTAQAAAVALRRRRRRPPCCVTQRRHSNSRRRGTMRHHGARCLGCSTISASMTFLFSQWRFTRIPPCAMGGSHSPIMGVRPPARACAHRPWPPHHSRHAARRWRATPILWDRPLHLRCEGLDRFRLRLCARADGGVGAATATATVAEGDDKVARACHSTPHSLWPPRRFALPVAPAADGAKDAALDRA